MKLRSVFDSVLIHTPVLPILAASSDPRLLVLAYHGVDNRERFAEHVEYLARTMSPVSLREVLDAIAHPGLTLPQDAVLITFDDADRTVLENAVPVLKRFKIPAVAFVIAGHLGTTRPFWWREVEQLMANGASSASLHSRGASAVRDLKKLEDKQRRRVIGELRQSIPQCRPQEQQLQRSELEVLRAGDIEIGNHTVTHPLLDKCTGRRIKAEIGRAHRILTNAVGLAPVAFAYPNGNWDSRAQEILKQLGYQAGFLFDHRIGEVASTNRFRISRVRVGSSTPMNRFRMLVNGLHSLIHHAIGRT